MSILVKSTVAALVLLAGVAASAQAQQAQSVATLPGPRASSSLAVPGPQTATMPAIVQPQPYPGYGQSRVPTPAVAPDSNQFGPAPHSDNLD